MALQKLSHFHQTTGNCSNSTIRFGHAGEWLLPRPVLTRDPDIHNREQLVLYFMCRFTCSRCWKTAMALAEHKTRFEAHDTTLVMVGNRSHLKAAAGLANGLRLPFNLVADCHGALRRRYNLEESSGCDHRQALVLVDRQGVVRYRQVVSSPGGRLRLASLMAMLETTTQVEVTH